MLLDCYESATVLCDQRLRVLILGVRFYRHINAWLPVDQSVRLMLSKLIDEFLPYLCIVFFSQIGLFFTIAVERHHLALDRP